MIQTRHLLTLLVLGACAAPSGTRGPSGPQTLASYPPRDLLSRRPLTRAERSSFTETSRYADVMTFVDSLKTAGKDLFVTTLGQSTQGRSIPVVILSRPVVRTPVEAKRLNRPVVYVQGNIHGGEVEGKEALLSLLRDLLADKYLNVLDSLVIIGVPIYNIDGNEAFAAQETNRTEQNGPALVGQRANGQGLDLNRDYVKAEAPETRAALDFFNAWDPDVFIDLHTTDGSLHGYALTYAPPLSPAALFTGPFTRDTLVTTIRSVLRRRDRIETFPYGNFISQDSARSGWFTYDARPRFGTNYYGLRGRIAILSEAYSHDPFRTRIASTYAFVMETLSLIAGNAEDILDVVRLADRLTTALPTSPSSSASVPIRARLTRTPLTDNVLVEETVATGDSTRAEPGMPRGLKRTGKVTTIKMPVFDRFEAALTQSLPFAWAIPPAQAALVEPLRRHGVFVEQLDAPIVVRGERFAIDSVVQNPRAFQGHQETRLTGQWIAADTVALETGTYIVRAAQPLGILALYLLDPQSDDGLVTWNFTDAWLRPGARFPVTRVLSSIAAPVRRGT